MPKPSCAARSAVAYTRTGGAVERATRAVGRPVHSARRPLGPGPRGIIALVSETAGLSSGASARDRPAARGGTSAANQEYLLQARQMQALSLAVHIPLVCFGIAFPAIVLFVESLYLRTGDPLYRTLAMRWSKVMITLFAVGVVTGTILSFEFGLLWPQFMSSFGNVFGLGFAFEGFSFFLEAIFIAIYVYAWDRISPRKHLACGVVVVITGVAGSLMVIAVNGWMNHPSGFRARRTARPWTCTRGRRSSATGTSGTRSCTCTSPATSSWASRSRPCYAWGALHGRWGRYEKTALMIPLAAAAVAAPVQVIVGDWVARDVTAEAAGEARGDRGPRAHDGEGARCTSSAGTTATTCATGSRSRACSRSSASTTRTRRSRGSTRCRRRTARRTRRST